MSGGVEAGLRARARAKKRRIDHAELYLLERYDWTTPKMFDIFRAHAKCRDAAGMQRFLKYQHKIEVSREQIIDVARLLEIPMRGSTVERAMQKKLKAKIIRAIKERRKPQEKVYI